MHNPESVPENETPLGFRDINGSPQLDQTTRPYNNQQKRENLQNYGLCCPSGPQSGINRMRKEGYLDLAKELKKLWNMKVTNIPIVTGALRTVTK